MYRSYVFAAAVAIAGQAYAGSDQPLEKNFVSFAKDTGEVMRIESAEHLRIYSQEVAAAACYLHNDIDVSLSAELLRESRAGFDKRLAALMHGDESLGIHGAEQRRKTMMKLEAVSAEWDEMASAVDALLADPSDKNAVGVIKDGNMKLFEMADVLSTEIEKQYANPAIIVQANVFLLEIVGRQAMMSQKIAKDACKIFSGRDDQSVKDLLSGSVSVYEASLDALINGMPAMGIQPAPTPEIADQLISVKNDWGTVRPIIDTLIAGGTVDRDTQVFLFKHMVEEMIRLEEITAAYMQHAKKIY